MTRVAGEIHAALADRYPLILCVMTGGMMFAGQPVSQLDFPLDFRLHACDALRSGYPGRQALLAVAPWTSVKGRTVLVVDDIPG